MRPAKTLLLCLAVGVLSAAAAETKRQPLLPPKFARPAGKGVYKLRKYDGGALSRFIKVDTGRAWVLEGDFRTAGEMSKVSLGLELFDADKKNLKPFDFTRDETFSTVLVKAVAPGDKALFVGDAGNWIPGIYGVALVSAPDGGWSALTVAKVRKTDGGFKLELVGEAKAALPEGSKVTRHINVPFLNAAYRQPVDGKWRRFRQLILPGEKFTGNSDRFWPGTRYARILISAPAGVEVFYKNLRLAPVAGERLAELKREQERSGVRLFPFNRYKQTLRKDGTAAYHVYPGGGVRNLFCDIKVDDAVQFEALVRADAPGMLELGYAGSFPPGAVRPEVKERSGYKLSTGMDFNDNKAAPVQPDGKPHWVIFNPEWKLPAGSKIKYLEFAWRNDNEAVLSVDRFRILKEKNLIPGANDLPRGMPLVLDYVVGGAKCVLEWRGAKNPGLAIKWLDADGNKLGVTGLAAGEKSRSFTIPELTVRGVLTVDPGGEGYPRLCNLPADAPEWHGKWIWSRLNSGPEFTTLWFRKEFDLSDAPVADAAIATAADDNCRIYVNGADVGAGGRHVQSRRHNVAKFLKPGKNELVLKVVNNAGFGGVICDLYIRSAAGEKFVSTDASWTFAEGEKRPAVIDRKVVEVGNSDTPRWQFLDTRYLGPRPVLKLKERGRNGFTAEIVSGTMPELPDCLQYKISSPGGAERYIMLDTKVTVDGKLCRFTYLPPVSVDPAPGVLRIDDDRLLLDGDPVIAEVAPAKAAPGLAQARFVRDGGHTHLELGGKRRSAFFWAFPARFQEVYTSRSFLIAAAKSAGYDNFALLTNFLEYWKGPNEFDFTELDNKVEQLLTVCPDAVFLLQIGCYMPDWWLNANPDDVTVREDGLPRLKNQERQALASKKWLADSRIALKALVDHVQKSPWGDRVWGANVAENTNWEWFWWTGRGEFHITGYSPADYASYRAFLRKRYADDAALAEAWGQPGVTFDTVKMPSKKYQLSGTVQALLDAKKDRALIDWFDFRNQVLAEAVIDLCKSLKKFSGNKWLTGAYYGYYVNQLTNVGSHSIHSAGHNGFWEVANSPYVDYIRAPAIYRLRRLCLADGNQAPQDTFTAHGKTVFIECDMRTSLREDPRCTDVRIARPATVRQTVDVMDRVYAMMLATGCSYYWYDIAWYSYLHPVLISTLKRQREIYEMLPPVRGLTPCEIALVGDRDSVYYTKHNNTGDSLLPSIALPLVEEFPRIGAPYRMLCNADILQKDLIPAHRFYVMYDSFMLSKADRAALLARFEREKASVLWLYAPGAFYPDAGPKQEFCADFLGVKMRMVDKKMRPTIAVEPKWGGDRGENYRATGPWFYPEAGYDEVLGRDKDGHAVLVSVKRNGATHYISTLTNLPIGTLRKLAEHAGVHCYTSDTSDPAWIGNDVVFIHAASTGVKQITLAPGQKLKKLLGPVAKRELESGEKWRGEAGCTYGFLVENMSRHEDRQSAQE